MDILITFININAQIIPAMILCFVPFWGYMPVPGKRIIFFGLILEIYCAALSVYIVTIPAIPYYMASLGSCLSICVAFFVYRSIIKPQLTKQLYTFFISMSYLIFATHLTNHIEAIYFPEYTTTYFNNITLLLLLVITGITMPIVWLLFRKKIGPVIQDSDAVYWKYMWLVPAITLIMLIFFNAIYDSEYFGNKRNFSVKLLLMILSFVTFYLLAEMVVQSRKIAKSQAEKEAFQRLDRMEREMVAVISHETRTPLAVLSGYAQLISMELRKQGVSEQIAQDLDKISKEAIRIANMMEQMQKLAIKGASEYKKINLDIGTIVRQIGRLYIPILARKNVNLEMVIPDNLPQVFANAEELTQILFNILQNAKNHIEEGTVTIKVDTEDSFIRVSVADTGSGIAPDLLPHIFESGISGDENDSGLGLAICKELIDSYGGEIYIESELGKGTVVTFTISYL